MRQTVIRIDESLYTRLKNNAKKQRRSLNNLMVGILEENTKEPGTRFSLEDFAPSDELLRLGDTFRGLTKEAASYDAKTQYILSK